MKTTNENQITDTILMVRPAHFGYNEETAENNAFQVNDKSLSKAEIQAKAREEFDEFVDRLRQAGVRVLIVEDRDNPYTPDAVFPNNWITMHADGTVVTYPMFAPRRRQERREDVLEGLQRQFVIHRHIPMEGSEAREAFLEGTGSMILDRPNRLVYACLSDRTDEALLHEFGRELGYEVVAFTAVDSEGTPIYHTNVMMALGETLVVIALDTVRDAAERARLLDLFQETNKEVVAISMEQMLSFAGNMLQVKSQEGKRLLVMSEQAYQSLTPEQLTQIKRHTEVLYSPLYTIETYGGGSARCMMAEVFLPEK